MMQHPNESMREHPTIAQRAKQVRAILNELPENLAPLTYQQLAERLQLKPPQTIHRVVQALEWTMHEDAAGDQPFIAALVISRTRGGLPAPGFFDLATRLGKYQGGQRNAGAREFHAKHLARALAGRQAAHDHKHSGGKA